MQYESRMRFWSKENPWQKQAALLVKAEIIIFLMRKMRKNTALIKSLSYVQEFKDKYEINARADETLLSETSQKYKLLW